MADTSRGKESRIAVAHRVGFAALLSYPRIVQGKVGCQRVVETVGHWMSVDREFVDYTEVQNVEGEGEALPGHIPQAFLGGAHC